MPTRLETGFRRPTSPPFVPSRLVSDARAYRGTPSISLPTLPRRRLRAMNVLALQNGRVPTMFPCQSRSVAADHTLEARPPMTTLDAVYLKAVRAVSSLFDEARRRGETDFNAGALATTGKAARPSVRTVTVERVSDTGVVFFANAESGKGRQMLENPYVSLCLRWSAVQHQVIIDGEVEVLSDTQADTLWRLQPREVGLGRWASQESGSNDELKARVDDVRERFEWIRVPRPPTWKAFEVHPTRIEIWPIGWRKPRARVRYLKGPDDGTWREEPANP